MSESFMLKTKEGSLMTRTLCIFCTLFILISCNQVQLEESKRNEVIPVAVPENVEVSVKEDPPSVDIPREALNWDAELYLVNFNPTQEEKVRRAVDLIKKVVRTQEFKQRVLNYQYKGEKRFFDNHGFSNEEIYQKILDGAEMMGNTKKNNMMDVELELYHQKTTTIGYTYPNTVRIWMNKKYFNRYTPIKVADNLMHEWMHKLGFTHAVKWSKDRDHSVPYAIGYLVEELAAKIPQ
ncbi:MAG: hypothetical protein ACLGHN_02395 [Bacteriovoracia bacterium]